MPRIAEYDNPVDGLRPSNQGMDVAAQAGRRIGSFYHQIGEDVSSVAGEYQRHVDQQTIGDYTATSAVHDLGYVQGEQQWLNSPQDPNNPNGPKNGEKPGAAIEYFHQFAASNDDLVAHATRNATPEVRDRIIASSSERMQALQRMAIGSQSELDRARSQATVDTVVNAAAATSYAGGDVDTTLKLALTGLDNLTTSLQQTDYARAQMVKADGEKLIGFRVVKGAIDGAADAGTPEGIARARQIADSPQYDQYIGENRGAIQNEIDAKEQHMIAQSRINAEQADKQRRDGALKASDEYLQSIWSSGSPNVPTNYIQRVMSDPRFVGEPEARDFALSLATRLDKKDTTADDQVVYGNLVQKQIQGTLTAQDLLQANLATGGRLGEKTSAMYRDLNNPPNPEKAAITIMKKGALDGAFSVIYPKSTAGMATPGEAVGRQRLTAWFETELERRQAGGDKPEDLLNPASPRYIFGGAALMQFGFSTDQELEYLKGTARPDPIIGNPAESRMDAFYWRAANPQPGERVLTPQETDAGWEKFKKDHPDWATTQGPLGGLSGAGGGGRPKLDDKTATTTLDKIFGSK